MTSQYTRLSHQKYRPDIDGIRAIAILAVIAFHVFPNHLEGGFIGVDIFFVISGYLISNILFKNLENDTFIFNEFYARRIKRIFPVLIFVLISCLAFGYFTLLSSEYEQLSKHIMASAGFVQNLVLWNESGYFDTSAETKPLLHLWSLGVEEQFYIIWPLLLWLVWRWNFNLLAVIVLVSVVSFYLNIVGVKDNVVATFYSPLTRFWELLAGGFLAYIDKKEFYKSCKLIVDRWLSNLISRTPRSIDGQIINNIFSIMGILLIAYGLWKINKYYDFPGKYALAPVIGTVLLIAAGPTAWINRVILSNKIAVFIGLISYSLYLWHWPLLSFLRIMVLEPDVYTLMVTVFIAFVLSILTYYFIEYPIRNNHSIQSCAKKSVFLMSVIFLLAFIIYKNDGFTNRHTKELNYIAEAINDWEWGKDGNNISINGVGVIANSDSKEIDVLIVGDSHAQQYWPRVKYLTEINEAKNIAFLTRSGCLPIPSLIYSWTKDCDGFVDSIRLFLKGNTTIRNVIIAPAFNHYFVTLLDPKHNSGRALAIKNNGVEHDFRDGRGVEFSINILIDFVKELSLKYDVTVLLDHPIDRMFNPYEVIYSNNRRIYPLGNMKVPDKFIYDERQQRIEKIMFSMLRNNGIEVRTQSDIVCPEKTCSMILPDGRPIYMDTGHMRPFYVIDKMDVIDKEIRKQ